MARRPIIPTVSLLAIASSLALGSAAGCGSPSAANIELRKQNQQLQDKIADLNRQHEADTETIAALHADRPQVPQLDQNRLDQLFTAVGLKFGQLTGFSSSADASDLSSGPGLKVYIVPTDQHGDAIKAAGSFTVDATDPTKTPEPVVGHWDFPAARAQDNWYGRLMLYTYVLPCPWANGVAPAGVTQVRIKVKFDDVLTGREILGETIVKPTRG